MRELFALYVAAMLGPASHNDVLLRMLTRPQWAFHPESVPLEAEFPVPELSVEPGDIELCGRLIEAFRKASEFTPASPGPIWSGIVERAYGRMIGAMEEPESLARFLSGMFRSEAVEGMATGQSYPNAMNEEGRRVWLLKLTDGLVSLAECLGAVDVENPEQNPPAWGLRDGLPALLSSIETALGITISFPNVGGAYGFDIGGRLITMEQPEHLEAAWRVLALARDRGFRNFVELGGGYGGAAYWICSSLTWCGKFTTLDIPPSTYRIYDLPHANVLQGYFLSKTLNQDTVSFYGETQNKVQVLPAPSIFNSPESDILINQNSIPEIPEETSLAYLGWAASHAKLLYSYNQECAMPIGGFRQGVVHRLVEKAGGFRRVSRSPAWVRRGYVEEVFDVVAQADAG